MTNIVFIILGGAFFLVYAASCILEDYRGAKGKKGIGGERDVLEELFPVHSSTGCDSHDWHPDPCQVHYLRAYFANRATTGGAYDPGKDERDTIR